MSSKSWKPSLKELLRVLQSLGPMTLYVSYVPIAFTPHSIPTACWECQNQSVSFQLQRARKKPVDKSESFVSKVVEEVEKGFLWSTLTLFTDVSTDNKISSLLKDVVFASSVKRRKAPSLADCLQLLVSRLPLLIRHAGELWQQIRDSSETLFSNQQ